MQIGEAIDRFLFATSLDARPATLDYYRRHLEPLRALARPIDAIDLDTLREQYAALRNRDTRYIDHPSRPELAGGLSIYTLHKYVRAWKRLFNWLTAEGIFACNPAAKLKRPKLPDHEPPKDMTPDDLRLMLNEAQCGSARDYAIVCLLADSAARVGGLVSLTIERVDLIERRAMVREKGTKTRMVHFKRRTALALARYINDERPTIYGPRLFIGRRGPLTASGVYLVLKRLAMRAGVKGRYNPHSLRHAWARQAIKHGGTLQATPPLLVINAI